MDKLIVESPAKINIGLNIIRKRVDGYHDLETIFYPLLLSDLLTFKKSDKTIFDTNSSEIASLKSNLIFHAKEILENFTQREMNVDIYLKKSIPMGAGLGGGSSNAAITLKALNNLFELKLNYNTLSSLALKIGSDVPFFLNPVPCFASSRGEVIQNIHLSISEPILIVNPGIHISTKWAFDNIKISEHKKDISELTSNKSISLSDIKEYVVNDFEDIVFEKYPEIKSLKNELYNLGASFVSMTGTGSSVYGIFTNLQKARWAKESFEGQYFTYLNFPVNIGSIT
jgi:4-diphosphocytidyl-2-C-methyl-D-erythritol kinase